MISKTKTTEYDIRFRTFLRQIVGVSKMKPKEAYLYKIMDGVPFKDLETAIMMSVIDYNAQQKKAFREKARSSNAS